MYAQTWNPHKHDVESVSAHPKRHSANQPAYSATTVHADAFECNLSRLKIRSCIGLPNPELQAGVLLLCSLVEHHVSADDKGVLQEQGVRHALGAAVKGEPASLALA